MRIARNTLLPAIAILVLLAVFIGCGYGPRTKGPASGGMALHSGLDKKTSSIGEHEIAALPGWQQGLLSSSAPGYNTQYRTPSDSAAPESAPGSATPPGDPASGNTGAGQPGGGFNVAESIERWFVPAAYAQEADIDERYLIRTGQLITRVSDFGASLDEVKAVAAQYKALITDSNVENRTGNIREGTITLRVPNTSFFPCWEELNAIGEVQQANIGSEDVSRQYVAAVSRLKNLTQEQETLRGMLDEALAVQRSRGLGEGYKILLDTQSRLSEVTGKIEGIENEISRLADRITRSTITVSLTQREKLADPPEFSWGLGATFDKAKKDLVMAVAGILNALVYFFVAGWLWFLPWLIVGIVAWRLFKRYVAPKLLAPPPTAPLEGQS